MNLFFLVYIAVIIYLLVPICKIVWNDRLDNNLLFLLSSNYIIIFLLSIIFDYQTNLGWSILTSFVLMLDAYFLIRKIKDVFGRYQLLSIPYFFLTVYVFSNILVLI